MEPEELSEVGKLFDQISFSLRSQCGHNITGIANRNLAVATRALLQIDRGAMRRIRIELQGRTDQPIDACG